MLHLASKFLVEKAKQERVALVTEDLKHINRGINRRGRKLRRRLNLWAHGRLRFMINYKADWEGLPRLSDVDPKGNSRTCPICGVVRARNGWVFKCSQCGIELSSHLVACINILRKASDEPSRIPSSAKALTSYPLNGS